MVDPPDAPGPPVAAPGPGPARDDPARADRELTGHVRAWCSGEIDAAALADALAGSAASRAAFWIGVARVETGEPVEAAASLRRWLAAGDDPETAAYARTLLVHAETGPVAAMRRLVDEHGDDWPGHCPFAVDRVVRDVADGDPTLLPALLRGWPETVRLDPATLAHAARRVLELALDAPHTGLASSRLALAERLLAGCRPDGPGPPRPDGRTEDR